MEIKQYIVGGFATNVYLAYSTETKDAFIVDPADAFDALDRDVKALGLHVRYIIITHGHGDHTGGIHHFSDLYPDAELVFSHAERHFIFNRDLSMGKGGYVADIEVKDGDSLNVGDMSLSFIDTPGHTPGGMCIRCGNILFAGDTLFQASIGRTDFKGGDGDLLIRSITEKLFVLPDEVTVLPGHGPSTTIGFEKRYNPFV